MTFMASPWTTLNPSDFISGTLSNGNLTFVTAPVGGADTYARATDGHVSGLYYFEINGWLQAGFDYYRSGIALGTTVIPGPTPASNILSISAVISNYSLNWSQVFIGGTSVFSDAADGWATTAGIAVNLNTHQIWIRPNPTAPWNGSATANPATGIGGGDISAFAGQPVFPIVTTHSTNLATFNCNFGQAAFAGAVPSGFTPGWPAQSSLIAAMPQICVIT